MSKEIPILFSTQMVKAIIDGRKSQTRRIMKPQLPPCDHTVFKDADWKDEPTRWSESAMLHVGKAYCSLCGAGTEYSKDHGGIVCPYGKPGDILWVRESWSPKYVKGCLKEYQQHYQDIVPWIYKVDHPGQKQGYAAHPWKPSIHMPKDAARIWLEVTGVRVQKLHEISDQDVVAEGIDRYVFTGSFSAEVYRDLTMQSPGCAEAKDAYELLWASINGQESWDANPWVWVIEFKVLSTTGKK